MLKNITIKYIYIYNTYTYIYINLYIYLYIYIQNESLDDNILHHPYQLER